VNPSMKIILPEGFSALRDDTLTLAVSIILALRHFLWIRRFSVQDCIGFSEDIMRISTQNNEEPLFFLQSEN
jgi:hypothetical protein